MKLLRWDTNTLPAIGDIVLSNSIENMDLVLAEMTRLYLAFGGDKSVSWDTDNKIDIIRDLETKITALLPEIKNVSSNVYVDLIHCYSSNYQTHYYNNLEDYIKNYGLIGEVGINQVYTCNIDFLEDIKEKNKRLYRLIQRLIMEFAYNSIICPITAVDYFEYIKDYLEEMVEDDPGIKDDIEEMKNECDQFDSLLPQPKIKRSVIRLQRLKKIYSSLREQLHPELTAWLDCTFEYLWLSRDEKTQHEFADAMNFIYNNNNSMEQEDNIADISSIVLMTVNYGSMLDNQYANDWDDHFNNGVVLPYLRVNIKGKEQMEKFNRLVNVISLFYAVIEHLPQKGDVYEKHM